MVEIRPGDIVFSRKDSFISKIIRMATLSQWSSVGVVVGRKHGRVKCISAKLCGGVVYNDLMEWGKDVQILRVNGITESQVQKVISFMSSQVGRMFDWKSCLSSIITKKQKCVKWFNSELVFMALLNSGVHLELHKHNLLSPGNLYESPTLKFVTKV